MDIDTSRFMSSQAAEYLRRAKECSEAADRTTDPENASHGGRRSDGRRAFCSIERIDPAETGQPKQCCVSTAEIDIEGSAGGRFYSSFLCTQQSNNNGRL